MRVARPVVRSVVYRPFDRHTASAVAHARELLLTQCLRSLSLVTLSHLDFYAEARLRTLSSRHDLAGRPSQGAALHRAQLAPLFSPLPPDARRVSMPPPCRQYESAHWDLTPSSRHSGERTRALAAAGSVLVLHGVVHDPEVILPV